MKHPYLIHLKAIFAVFILSIVLWGTYEFIISPRFKQNENVVSESKKDIQWPIGEFTDFNQKKFNFESFKGKTIIFNFWASWCAPCIEEVPSLIKLIKEDKNIVIFAVSGDQSEEDIRAFLKSFPEFNKQPIYLIWNGAKPLMDSFGVDKLPESFIFDKNGKMVKKISGTINWHTPDSIEYFKMIR